MDINKPISDNRGLIYAQLHKFDLANDQEAESIAYDAMHKAALTFKDEKNTSFTTYATVCIYNALCGYRRLLSKKRQISTISYYTEIDEDFEICDTLPSNDDLLGSIVQKEYVRNVVKTLQRMYSVMPAGITKKIIGVWIESDFTALQSEIAMQVGTTQAHVSYTLASFRQKLKKETEDF